MNAAAHREYLALSRRRRVIGIDGPECDIDGWIAGQKGQSGHAGGGQANH